MALRDEMAALYDELQAIPDELGFRERTVTLRSYTVTGENRARQIPGTRTAVDTVLSPAPMVEEVDLVSANQYVLAAGGVIEAGDLRVKGISRTYAENTLRGASEWVVDGVSYRLASLYRRATSWDALIRRAKS